MVKITELQLQSGDVLVVREDDEDFLYFTIKTERTVHPKMIGGIDDSNDGNIGLHVGFELLS